MVRTQRRSRPTHPTRGNVAKRQRSRKRFRLLIYERMWQQWAWPCALTVPASIGLWWYAPRISILHAPFRLLTLVPAGVALVVLAYIYLARRMAWVQCKPNHLRIQTPVYPLVVSYGRIKGVRPQQFSQIFDPASEKAARRRWLHPYWGKTALVVDMSRYPVSRIWLSLWFSPYLLAPDSSSFVFLVEDWMALSQQVDDSRSAWQMRRKERRQQTQARRF